MQAAYNQTKQAQEANLAAFSKTEAGKGLTGDALSNTYTKHLAEEGSTMGTIAKGVLSKNANATLADVETAYGVWMQDEKNNPNVHEVGLQAGGMASNQWLISTLQTPFSGTLSQDQKGLILHNESGVTDDFANVRDQNNAITSIMSAGQGRKFILIRRGRE